MGFAKISSKIILSFLSVMFWAASAALSYIGANIFISYERYGDILSYLYSVVPAFVILAVAFLMFLIGIVGIIGLFSENRCFLGSYFSMLTVLLACQIAGVVLTFMYRDNVNVYINEWFNDEMDLYGQSNNTQMTQNFDFIQSKLQCCGKLNYSDWQHTWWYQNSKDRYGNVPQSCCVNYVMNNENNNQLINTINKRISGVTDVPHYCQAASANPVPSDNFYVHGCYAKIRAILRTRFVYIAGITLALIMIQFIGLISTCILMFCRNKHAQQPPYINIATHEDVHYNL